MTRTEFPKPVGAPQLVVTHKSAYLLDAHVPNKVLLHVKAPKVPTVCFSSEVASKTQGNWALSISDRVVTCTYADWDVYGKWRAELLPAGQDGNVVQVCNQGFVAQAPSLGSILAAALCLIIVVAGATEVIALRSKIEGMDLRLHDLARRQPMGPGPQRESGLRGPTGPPRPIGQRGPKGLLPCTKPSDWDDELDGIWTPPQPGIACLEFTNKGSAAAPAHADLASTFPLGMQLGSGESATLGKITWKLLDCRLSITHENAHSTYLSDGTSYPDQCVFVMQYDGNGVIYNKDKGSAVWATRDHLHRSCFYGLTADAATSELQCQFQPPLPPLPEVKPKFVPATKDTFKPGSFLLHGDGVKLGDYNLILVGCQLYLTNGEKLRPVPHQRQEEKVVKTGCILTMQMDGDLVMYHEKNQLWSTSELWKENPEKCTKGVTVSTNGGIICQN